ncbi:2-isopropylmalate synthase [Sulfobacillus thermosulfidooxidans]|uniref:2-isopropylmalate synthase n=1 Tax=Sulfobacillus thermosulfidooxidans TaxID=28034 RepID=A0A1R0IQ78_SULTH|nr:2-isopropylmalate synthase [Sulfobacillus thermosulfidooxidans]OLZ09873.1 2-isopropylmalate synthase [Sulfobacillus thermosulfidooxidans]OLZ15821.1 2-isopropylmalate synthase [Sulfobacillus thermosulfidooxidans]OLZ18332.1 2-isopropylmalate synthase [Sulfobacillus thermosulfidooxidans]PSR24957.1 MAG: 2-isopropylmalate synthase [Sulfobacillus thermosulfidooxidans]
MTDTVRIFDTTLRDGEQSPGVALSTQEKLAIAEQLARLGVDYLEAGFPQASPGDFEAVSRIAENIKGPTITALARCNRQDIEQAARALEKADKARIHVFIATSPIHMQAKLRMTPEQVLERIDQMVRVARMYVDDVEFSCEDATRSQVEFLVQAGQLAVDAGATTLNFPDTVGYTTPREYFQLITHLRKAIADPRITLSVHCHDDLGLAVANSLSGIEAGCRQVEVAINGIGERAGNASLEEVVMTLTARQDQYHVQHHIKTQEIYRASQLVSQLTGMPVQPNKAIVGKNAFRHESGIHQDGMLKDRSTYEILTPEAVGWGMTKLVLGKHSGRHALRQRLEELGLHATQSQIDQIQQRVKTLGELKSDINDQDLEAIWQEEVGQVRRSRNTELVHWQVSTGSHNRPVAYVSVRVGQEIREDSGSGDGPVHALFQAFARALSLDHVQLTSYHLAPISPGEAGLASVRVEIHGYDCETRGQAADSDVMKATAVALHEALAYLFERVQNVVA